MLDESIAKNPNVEALYGYRSEVLLGLGRYQDAMVDAQKIVTMNPNSAEVRQLIVPPKTDFLRDIIALGKCILVQRIMNKQRSPSNWG